MTPLPGQERENGVAPSGNEYLDESSDDDDEEGGDDELDAEVSEAPSVSTAMQVGFPIGLKLRHDWNPHINNLIPPWTSLETRYALS